MLFRADKSVQPLSNYKNKRYNYREVFPFYKSNVINKIQYCRKPYSSHEMLYSSIAPLGYAYKTAESDCTSLPVSFIHADSVASSGIILWECVNSSSYWTNKFCLFLVFVRSFFRPKNPLIRIC